MRLAVEALIMIGLFLSGMWCGSAITAHAFSKAFEEKVPELVKLAIDSFEDELKKQMREKNLEIRFKEDR